MICVLSTFTLTSLTWSARSRASSRVRDGHDAVGYAVTSRNRSGSVMGEQAFAMARW